jgi:hypothetical protein
MFLGRISKAIFDNRTDTYRVSAGAARHRQAGVCGVSLVFSPN